MQNENNSDQKVKPWVVWTYLFLMLTAAVIICYNIVELYKLVNSQDKFDREYVQNFVNDYRIPDPSDTTHKKLVYNIPSEQIDSLLKSKNSSAEDENKREFDANLLLLIAYCGALGSIIYILSSFTNFWGNRKLENNWLPWYVAKPFVGAGLAIVGYFVLRAGFLTANSTSDLNFFGILSLACFMGLFSDEATLKLKEIFEVIFKPKDERKGALDNSGKNAASASSANEPPVMHEIEILDMTHEEIKPDTETEIKITGHNFPDDYHIKYNTEVLSKENIIKKDDNVIRFKLPKIPAGIKEVKIYIYDPKSNKDVDAGTIVVK